MGMWSVAMRLSAAMASTDALVQLELGLAGLVQVAAQQVGGGEGRHVLVDRPAISRQEEASVGLR